MCALHWPCRGRRRGKGEVHWELRSLRSAAAALKLCHRQRCRRRRRRRRRARHAACCNACKQDLTIKF